MWMERENSVARAAGPEDRAGVAASLRGDMARSVSHAAGSPHWEVGTAVAGRLEEMRARELGASLRAKVQENEAMRRYLDSVKVREGGERRDWPSGQEGWLEVGLVGR